MSEITLTEEPQSGAGEPDVVALQLPTVTCRIDTYADETLPGQNFGDRARLKLNGGVVVSGLVFIFLARPFPLGATITEAKLKLYLSGAWAGAQTITAKRITAAWKERNLTWNYQPTVVAANSADVVVTDGVADQEIELDLEPMLNDVSAGELWFGVRLELSTNNDRKLWSSENPIAALRPVLELDWKVPPLAPTGISPAGGRAVSLANPTISWRFKDPEDEGQSASQVQLSTTESFAAPEYDSGKVANADSQWDLGDTAYAGVPANATRFVRVRAWDDADLVSEWSETEEFERRSKGALTIVNPAEAPNDFVEETTPPLDWTFTGRTQERTWIELFSLDDIGTPDERLARWHTHGEEPTSVTVPPDLLKSGNEYRVHVRVWDNFEREATPGDPPFVQESRDFTYERSGTPAAVTALTAVPDGGMVLLTWQRATQPDYFSLRVDGKEVKHRIDPEDVWDSGTTYSMEWWLAEPHTELTYEVEAVVRDGGKLKHSDGNSEVTATLEPVGIWLVDPEDGENVEIRGTDVPDMAIGEVGTTYRLIGSRKPVRITDSVGGYEGSFSGTLLTRAARNRLLHLKGRNKVLRLIIKDLNIPVRLEEVSAPPQPEAELRYSCTVAFFQVGSWPMRIVGD